MGNCAGGASRHAASWATDDSEPVLPVQEEEESVVEVATAGGEVTIRISRRRLQELMAKAAGGEEGVTAEKVLAEIVSAGEVVDVHRRRWEPALQSIPEAVVES